MTKLALIAAALALAAASPGPAQTGAPVVGGSPSGAAGAVPEADGVKTQGSGSSRPTPAAVKERLEREGYTQVTDVEEGRDGWTATAVKGGRTVKLAIDPAGSITEQE